MGKTLILAEKPSAANDIRKGLEKYGSFKKLDWGFESDRFLITWLVGHVLSLKEPKEYENWGGKWLLEPLPWFPPDDHYLYKENERTKDVFKKVASFMKRKDITLIVNACDAEREGDLIFWELYDYLNLKTPVKRFWESASLTPAVVQHVMENDLKDQSFYEPRKDAAYARAFADLLLGMNFTVGFTAKAGSMLHMGRVQTPTIAILAKRRKEIEEFQAEDYVEIEAVFQNEQGQYKGMWFKDQLGNTKIESEKKANEIIEKATGHRGVVTKKEVKDEQEPHKLLYSLTTLQQEANRKFGFSATETLQVAQSLYETHKILSYPRTGSEVLGSEHVKQLEPTLNSMNVGGYQPFVQAIVQAGVKTTKRFVDDSKLTDHHAIIPMNVTPNFAALNEKEKKIYDLVAKRFLSAFYPPALYEKTEIVTQIEGETFKTSGKIEKDPGWKVVYGKELDEEETKKKEQKDTKLPMIVEGEENKVLSLQPQAKKTQPPKHYNEASLLGVMKNPKKFLSDKELQDVLADTEAGLGTPATQAAIIENIVARGYVEKKGKQLIASDLGMKLIEVCPEELKSPEITAEWEQKLKQISQGKFAKDTFMSEIKQYIEQNIHHLKTNSLTVTFENKQRSGEKIGVCPVCQGDFLEREFKGNKMYYCANSTKENRCFMVYGEIAGKKLTVNVIKQLLEKGETAVLKGFKSKAGKKFDAKLKREEKQVTFAFDHFEPQELGVLCPTCQGKTYEKEKVFSCENSTREHTCFVLFKSFSGKTLTAAIAKELIGKGATGVIKGFKSRDGKRKFDAALKLENGKVTMVFENNPIEKKETTVLCPKCSGKLIEKDKVFSCENSTREKSCSFFFKTIAGKVLTEDLLKEVLKKGKTEKLKGFQSKAGKSFEAFLVYDPKDNSIKLSFQ